NPTHGLRISKMRGNGEEVWLALAAIRLFEAKGFSGLALAVLVRALAVIGLSRGRPYISKGGAPMSTIAAAAQTADRIDYWIRRYVIRYCYATHPSQSQSKFNPARDRRVGLLAIGQCLKEQYDALSAPETSSRISRRGRRRTPQPDGSAVQRRTDGRHRVRKRRSLATLLIGGREVAMIFADV